MCFFLLNGITNNPGWKAFFSSPNNPLFKTINLETCDILVPFAQLTFSLDGDVHPVSAHSAHSAHPLNKLNEREILFTP